MFREERKHNPRRDEQETFDPLKKEEKKQSLEDYIQELDRKYDEEQGRLKDPKRTAGKYFYRAFYLFE